MNIHKIGIQSVVITVLIVLTSLVLFVGFANAVGTRLADPYIQFRTALNTANWSEEDYARAYAFNVWAINEYSSISEQTTSTLDQVQTWHDGLKVAIDLTDLAITFTSAVTSNLFPHTDQQLLKAAIDKLETADPYRFSAYITKINKLYPNATIEDVKNGLAYAAWAGKLGMSKGLGDPGVGDFFDFLINEVDDTTNSQDSFYNFFENTTSGTWIHSILFSKLAENTFDYAVNLTTSGTEAVPWQYISIEVSNIMVDIGAAMVLQADDAETKAKLAAIEFLKYYLIGFKGDRVAFELALGKSPEVTWTLGDAFYAFSRSFDYVGNVIMAEYDIYVESAELKALHFLVDYLKSNSITAFTANISPQKTAYRDPDNNLATSTLQAGENITYSISLDSYLADMGCTFTSNGVPGFSGITEAEPFMVSGQVLTHQLHIAQTGFISFTHPLLLNCNGDQHSLAYYFADTTIAPLNYFDISSPLTISASSSKITSLGVDISTPPVETLFTGEGGEIINARGSGIRYWVEEEKESGVWERVKTFYHYDPMVSGAILTASTSVSFQDYSFFVDRTGSHNFRMGIELLESDYPIEGSNYSLTWTSPTLTVRAQDVQWNWTYSPTHITVADPALAEYDDREQSLNLFASDQTFSICAGSVNIPTDWGTDYTVKLELQGVGQEQQILDSVSWDDQTGCATFHTPDSDGRYLLQHLYAEYTDSQNIRHTILLDGFDPDSVLLTADESSDNGSGTEVSDEQELITWGITRYNSNDFADAKFTAMSTDGQHTLALKDDGTLVAWGRNDYGQSDVYGFSNVKAVAAGSWFSVILRNDGSVFAWGSNIAGELAVPTGNYRAIAVSASSSHALLLKDDGTVAAWGDNYYGTSNVPEGLNDVKAISTANSHSLALKNDGTVVTWGNNSYGQLDVPDNLTDVVSIAAGSDCSYALKSDGSVVAWGNNSYGALNIPTDLNNVTAIAAGSHTGLALKQDGTVVAWGYYEGGLIAVPPGLSDVVSITAGGDFAHALKQDGTIVSWGGFGNASVPMDLNASEIKAVSVGNGDVIALKNDGTVIAWGQDNYGETNVPEGLNNVIAVSTECGDSLALKDDGTVVHWGRGAWGNYPPSGLDDVIAIEAGCYHSLALKQDGTVVAWGLNDYGQVNVPAELTGVISIAAGRTGSLALREDGTVVEWGENGSLDLPDGLLDIQAISANGGHYLALKSDGSVVAWGSNYSGESDVPSDLIDVKLIVAGSTSSHALKNDGSVVTWGINDTGYDASDVPSGLHNVQLLSVGNSFAAAVGNLTRPSIPEVSFIGENLPDGSFLVGSATKQWHFQVGEIDISGLKAVQVSAEADLGIEVSEIDLGDVSSGSVFDVTLPINPQRGNHVTLSSIWKLVDGNGNNVSISNSRNNTFWLKVSTNHRPVFSPLQIVATGGQTNTSVSLELLGEDDDGDSLTYSIVSGSGSINGNTWTGSYTAPGVYSLTVRVSDGLEYTDQNFDIVISDGGALANFFTDVPSDSDPNSVYAAVTFLATKGIVIGASGVEGERYFEPDRLVSQAEGLKMVLRSAELRGFVTIAAGDTSLPNLVVYDPENGLYINYSWAAPYAATAEKLGMIDNALDWDPATPVTRSDIARWLTVLLQLKVPLNLLDAYDMIDEYMFNDADSFPTSLAYDRARSIAFFGYLGTLKSDFGPEVEMARGELAVVAAKILRTPTIDGLSFTGVDTGERFGITQPFISEGQLLGINGVQNLSISEILMNGVEVSQEWIDSPSSYVRIKVMLSDGTSLGTGRLVEELATNSFTLDTGSLDIHTDTQLTLIVLLRSEDNADMSHSGVGRAYFIPVAVDFPDLDGDGVRDDLDSWPDDARFCTDENSNNIPDDLETMLAAMGLDGNEPAMVDGIQQGYSLYEAIIEGYPYDQNSSNRQEQTIDPGTVPSSLNVGELVTLNAYASSELPITYSTIFTQVCTVSGNTITGVATGICTVAINQSGDAYFNPAQEVVLNFAVTDPSPTPPGAPTSVTATPGDSLIKVSFTPPLNDGGSPITGYVASCSASDYQTQNATGSLSPIVVTGLTNGVAYNCSVSASNAVGTGPATSLTESVTPVEMKGRSMPWADLLLLND